MNPPAMGHARIVLVTGARQIGKSTALSRVVDIARSMGVQVSGLLTQRTGPHSLAVTELATGASYPLTAPYIPDPESATPRFVMNEEALARSARALEGSFPTELFVLDELGPLEFRRRQGWIGALDLLARATYALAIVVVRPELLGDAICELPGARFTVVKVTAESRDSLPDLLMEDLAMCTGRELNTIKEGQP